MKLRFYCAMFKLDSLTNKDGGDVPKKHSFKRIFIIIISVLMIMIIYHVDWVFVRFERGRGKQVIPNEMIFVDGGTFTMGCTSEHGDDCVENQWVSEYPAHSVTVGNFYIGKYPVTGRLWKEVMGPNNMPPGFEGDDLRPVVNVWWSDVQEFITKLNQQTGKKYRLPTEAEWEYVARGGSKSKGYKYSGSNNIDDVAWYGGNSGRKYHWGRSKYSYMDSRKPRVVGIKQANELGIHDMSGNVGEWLYDWYEGYTADARMNPTGRSPDSLRVVRGGSWGDDMNRCRVNSRASSASKSGDKYTGFRLALDPGVDSGDGSDSLTVTVTPNGGGTVSRDLDREAYPAGTNVTLTAEVAPGYVFNGWTAAAAGKEDTVWSGKEKLFRVAMIGNMKVTAVFEKIDIEKDFAVAMVQVQGGTFTMGCTERQGRYCEDNYNELPPHSVTVSSFYIGKYEVTQRLWKVVMGSNPSEFSGDAFLPVENVSWNDIQEFINRLNRQTGKKYRLPTEAEWEYAARGGNNSKGYGYSGSNNIDEVAWYAGNSGDKTQIVGTKQPNELGIHDMNGNVSEWVNDWYGVYTHEAKTNPIGLSSGSYRVSRGGSWYVNAEVCRVSSRNRDSPDNRFGSRGFRLALSP